MRSNETLGECPGVDAAGNYINQALEDRALRDALPMQVAAG